MGPAVVVVSSSPSLLNHPAVTTSLRRKRRETPWVCWDAKFASWVRSYEVILSLFLLRTAELRLPMLCRNKDWQASVKQFLKDLFLRFISSVFYLHSEKLPTEAMSSSMIQMWLSCSSVTPGTYSRMVQRRSHTRKALGKAVKLGRMRAVLLSNGLPPMHVPFSSFLYTRSKKPVVVAGIHELLCTRKSWRECSHFRRRKMEMIVKEDLMQEISPSFMASSDNIMFSCLADCLVSHRAQNAFRLQSFT